MIQDFLCPLSCLGTLYIVTVMYAIHIVTSTRPTINALKWWQCEVFSVYGNSSFVNQFHPRRTWIDWLLFLRLIWLTHPRIVSRSLPTLPWQATNCHIRCLDYVTVLRWRSMELIVGVNARRLQLIGSQYVASWSYIPYILSLISGHQADLEAEDPVWV